MASKILSVGEHSIIIPEPKSKEDILFFDRKDPYWIREESMKDYRDIFFDFIPGRDGTKLYQQATLYNQDGELVSLNKEDSDWMVWAYERETKRRTYGVHFKNGDEISYLTGDHYFVLQWCKTKRPDKKGDYFDYREFQSYYFNLIKHVNTTPYIDGLFLSKAKKTGITNLHWLYYLNKATLTKNINLGAMNLTQDISAKTFRDYFLYAFNGLPRCLKPKIKTKSDVDGVITFGERTSNSRKNTRSGNDFEELNTTVMCVPTEVSAFDVDVFSDIYFDEPPKYKKDFGEIYRSNEAGTSIQDVAIGKKWLTSYTPEGEAPSFMAARNVFFDSELRTVTERSSKRTKSGLICVHIPAYQSWTSSFDKNGRCNEGEAMDKIMDARQQLKDRPRELQTLKRRYANDKTEAWAIGGSGSTFDLIRLGELVVEIEKNERESPENTYREGKLIWANPLWELGMKNKRPRGTFTNVLFVPLTDEEKELDEKGRLREYYPIPKTQQNAALLNGRDEWNCLIPPPEFMSFYGADPTQHASGSEVIEGSKNAYHVMNKADHRLDQLYGRVATKVITHEYFYRPELPDEAYEDLVKLIIYTNSIGIVEANVPEFATRLIAEGLGRFMLVKDEDGVIRPWERYMGLANETDKSYHLIRTTSNSQENKDRLELFVALMKRYFHRPAEGEKDYGATIKSARLINQCANVDTTNTKIFDLFMSWGYCLTAEEMYSIYRAAHANDNVAQMGFAAVLSALAS